MSNKPEPSYIAVTPETAERWLSGNTVNRKLRERRVQQYARDMVAGRWHSSNDAIAFDPDGHLINGQHRLNAVARSGVTVVFLVVRNMPSESMTTMDSGAGRSAGDALKFIGETHAPVLAAVTKLCIIYTDGRIYRDNKTQAVSHGEILDFLERHPTIRQSIAEVGRAHRSIDAPTSPVIAAHWIISGVNDFPLATHYFHQLASRANEPEGSAVLAVDSRFREVRRNKTSLPPRNFIYLLVKGWNYYARDQRVRSMNITPRGQFSIPDPVKWDR